MNNKAFLCGNEAVAEGIRLAAPQVIAAYPITPQTVAVERLAEMVEDGSLVCEFLHLESEHSALSACMGASAMGVRSFTATSSQGLLYMAECLHYASGGRLPIVMMNANRSVALPWSIYGDHRDSLSQLDCGWIQVYVENAQESLDMAIQSYAIAEHPLVLTPVMLNLDGFTITHTYELVEIPEAEAVNKFLPQYDTSFKMDLNQPKNMAFSSSPADNMEFKYQQHRAIQNAKAIIQSVDASFGKLFGRTYGGLVDAYRCEDARLVIICIGSIAGTCRTVVDQLRDEGQKTGLLKIRFMRPFPDEEIATVLHNAKAIAVIDRDISFGYEGTVFTNVCSALAAINSTALKLNFIAGLGGRDISCTSIRTIFEEMVNGLAGKQLPRVTFLNLSVLTDEPSH